MWVISFIPQYITSILLFVVLLEFSRWESINEPFTDCEIDFYNWETAGNVRISEGSKNQTAVYNSFAADPKAVFLDKSYRILNLGGICHWTSAGPASHSKLSGLDRDLENLYFIFVVFYILFYTADNRPFSLEWSSLMLQMLQGFMTPLRIQRHCLTCYSGVLFLSGWTPSIRSNLRYWTYLTPCLSNFPGFAQCTNFSQWLFPYLFRGCHSHLCHGWSLFYSAYFIIFAPPVSEPWVDKGKSWT